MIIHDIYENLRVTKSDLKSNKKNNREYNFDDGENHPKTKQEYKKRKKANPTETREDR